MKKYILSLVILSFLFSCKKADNIGDNILLGDDLLNLIHTDSFVLNTKTVSEDPLRTDKLVFNYVGVLDNAQYGKSVAKLMFELAPPIIVPDDSLGPFTIDSAVLFLKYTTVIGDTNATQNIVVKTLNADILEEQFYYSNNSTIFGTTEVGRANSIAIQPSNYVKTYEGDTTGTPSLIRIPIDLSYAQSFVDKIGSSDSVFLNYTYFNNYFRGLEVAFENNNGNAMALVDLTSTKTRLIIYIKDKNGFSRELNIPSRIFTVIKNSTNYLQAASINVYENNYSSRITNALSSSSTSDSTNFIIGQSGVMNKISLPDLSTISGPIAFNKALLQVTQIEANSDTSSNASVLYAMYKNTSNQLTVTTLGTRDSVYINNNSQLVSRYTFNVTRLMSDIILGRKNVSELYITNHNTQVNQEVELNDISYLGGFSPTRIIIGGGNNSETSQKTKLKLYFSK